MSEPYGDIYRTCKLCGRVRNTEHLDLDGYCVEHSEEDVRPDLDARIDALEAEHSRHEEESDVVFVRPVVDVPSRQLCVHGIPIDQWCDGCESEV